MTLAKKRIAKGKASSPSAYAGLELFHSATANWFRSAFSDTTAPQREGWPAIARGESTLISAPTGTGKTLTAFLWCLDRLMLMQPPVSPGCRVLYVSPLKALAVDVERNLRVPLAGIAHQAEQDGVSFHLPEISVRTGDTSSKERARFKRHPGEILVTTPESLYLLLTSEAAESLRTVETVILDEIHALVATKRGAHMALSLERLEALTGRCLQRIGLSATQRPLEEVAHFLGGAEAALTLASEAPRKSRKRNPISNNSSTTDTLDSSDSAEESQQSFRPVTLIAARTQKKLDLRIEVPVEDMARLGGEDVSVESSAKPSQKQSSIWQSIHPRLLEMIRNHTSTLIFVNARRVAERLAGALNELAGESLVRAHHGSLAASQRSEIEEMLKAGTLKALVCTSSLELGIDMGSIDLVVQIEAPPSVASGMQRIGRAGHQVNAVSSGVIFPKYRADLLACAAVTEAMQQGHVEATRFLRNPLDVLAQQMVAIIAHPPLPLEQAKLLRQTLEPESESPGISYQDLLHIVRGAAPFAALSTQLFEGVLDMLAGRYPSDEFAELRPRVTWDRKKNWITPRQGAKRLAILNGGTIPDRGLYGVFLSGASKPVRVGELDEEMVFEARIGETFVLGASTWRIDEITPDRVLVSPAPGEPGKMPFWHGDLAGRPIEFGRRIGALTRELLSMPRAAALTRLTEQHELEMQAAENALRYLADQQLATGEVPNDQVIVIERLRDELGDWRICVLTPFGSRIHMPWAMAANARLQQDGTQTEIMWSEDGFVLRFPQSEQAPEVDFLLLDAEQARTLLMQQLGSTALFATKFREAASRALLLPRHRATGRMPLWQQRKRAYDLLSVASRYETFPLLLEAYRECLRDVFDMPALQQTLRSIHHREIRVHVTDSRTPSPFARSLLFSYVANYIYEGDAPLAERRAQALAIDQDQLRELLGDADLRELLDLHAMEQTEAQLQCVAEGYRVHNMDGLHDLLLRLGDLSYDEIALRCDTADLLSMLPRLLQSQRVLELDFAGEKRLIAVEDAARFRYALKLDIPLDLPSVFLEAAPNPLLDILRRYARTHGAFSLQALVHRYALPAALIETTLQQLVSSGRVLEGGFRPGGAAREWIDAEVLRSVRRKSLARLRKEVEPVEQSILARMVTRWQGSITPRQGLDALLDVIESLQGAPLPASLLESEILPARIAGYKPSDLGTLIAAGEVVWVGLGSLGERDGRIALYLAEKLDELWPPQRTLSAERSIEGEEKLSERELAIVEYLRRNGASFFQPLHEGSGGGYPGESVDALWSLVWRGIVSNDALQALRAYVDKLSNTSRSPRRIHQQGAGFRSRSTTPPSAQGRWGLNRAALRETNTDAALLTRWSHSMAQQLLHRYGIVFRETAQSENLPGGFSAIYDVLKTLEESGRVRRGYFVADLGAAQFAMPAAVELLRTLRIGNREEPEVVLLAATDPANPYGALLRWPPSPAEGSVFTRSVGARVVLIDGELIAFARRASANLLLLLPDEEPRRSQLARALAEFFVRHTQQQREEPNGERGGWLIATVNGVPVAQHPLASFLLAAGFQPAPLGFNVRR